MLNDCYYLWRTGYRYPKTTKYSKRLVQKLDIRNINHNGIFTKAHGTEEIMEMVVMMEWDVTNLLVVYQNVNFTKALVC